MLSITIKTNLSCRQFIGIQMLSYIHLDIHHICLVSAKSELFTHSSDTITAHVQTQQTHSGLPVHVFNLHLAGALFQGTGQVSHIHTASSHDHIHAHTLIHTHLHTMSSIPTEPPPPIDMHTYVYIYTYIYIYISRYHGKRGISLWVIR